MTKYLCLLSVLLLMFTGFNIQGQQLVFDKLHHNFGEIPLQNGQVIKYSFHYTNNSSDTLNILSVTSSSQATLCDWSQESIIPGQRGFVNISLKTSDLKDDFRQVINIRSNDSKHPYQQLIVEGRIIDKELSIEERYPVKLGNLKMKRSHLVIDNFMHNTVRSDSLEIYNSWDQIMTFNFESLPDYLKAIPNPVTLKPGEEGVIVIEYDALQSNHWGLLVNAYRFNTNEPGGNSKTFTVGINVKEDFSKLSKEDIENAPNITFNESKYHFGKIPKDTIVSFEFVFTNAGKSDLLIRKAKASCGCTSTKPTKTLIKPGDTGSITVTFNTKGYSGKQSKMVTVICNDPKKPVNFLTIEANIEL
ncbi:DUF1573 domain-containing protein [candidate division KSB1 bacterium]